MSIFDVAGTIARGTIGDLMIESAVLPPLLISSPLGAADAGAGDGSPPAPQPWLVRLIRPRVTVATSAGPVVVQPAGAPPDSPMLGFALAAVAVVVVGLAVVGAVSLVRR